MPKLSLGISHQLTQAEATQRLKDRLAGVKEAYGDQVSGLEEKWSDHRLDFRFSTFGVTIKGDVTSAPTEVRINADLPMMALMFKGTIEQRLREEFSKALA